MNEDNCSQPGPWIIQSNHDRISCDILSHISVYLIFLPFSSHLSHKLKFNSLSLYCGVAEEI